MMIPTGVKCPNRHRKWWSLGFAVRCNDTMELLNDFEDFARCMTCGFKMLLPPNHPMCRCVWPSPPQYPPRCDYQIFSNRFGTMKAIVCSCGFATTYTVLGDRADELGLEFFHFRHTAARGYESKRGPLETNM